MVYNNRNTSPVSKMENEYMEKVYIAYTSDLNDLDDVFDIGNYLEKEGLISGFNLDRIDNKDTSKEHYNFYFDSDVNNNSLNAIIDNYIKNREIDYTKIKQLKEELKMAKELKIKGIGDTSETIKKPFKGLEGLEDVLNIKENNDLKYIGMDSMGATTIKEISANLGKGRDTIPERLSFSIFFDKDLDLDDKDEDLGKTLKDTFNYFGKDTSLLNPTFSIDGTCLNVELNNVLKNPNANEYFLMGAKQYRKRMENFIASYLDKKDLTLTTNKFVYESKLDRVKDLKDVVIKEKTIIEDAKEKKILVDRIEKSEVTEVEKTPKNINVDFVNQVARFKGVEEFETLKEDLKSDLESMEKAKKFIPNFEEQFKEVTNKINLLDIKKDEFIKQNDKDNKIKELELSLNDKDSKIKVLEKETIELKASIEKIENKAIEQITKIQKELKQKLNEKDLTIDNYSKVNDELETNNKNLFNERNILLKDKNELSNKLETKVNEFKKLESDKNELSNEFTKLETNFKIKDKENISLNNELKETKIEVEKAIDVISSLQKSVLDLTNVSLKLEKTTIEKQDLLGVISSKDEQLEQYRYNNSNYLDRLEQATLRISELEKEIRHTNNNLGLDNLENLAKNKIEEIADKLNSNEFDSYVKSTLEEKGTFSDVLKTLNIEKDERGNIKNISTIDSNNESFEKKPNETKINNIDE